MTNSNDSLIQQLEEMKLSTTTRHSGRRRWFNRVIAIVRQHQAEQPTYTPDHFADASKPMPVREQWECFCDEAYFGMWAVRPVGENRWGHCFHVQSREEAEGLVSLLNSQPEQQSVTDCNHLASTESPAQAIPARLHEADVPGVVDLPNAWSEIPVEMSQNPASNDEEKRDTASHQPVGLPYKVEWLQQIERTARQDNWHYHIVGSDIRKLVAIIRQYQEGTIPAQEAAQPDDCKEAFEAFFVDKCGLNLDTYGPDKRYSSWNTQTAWLAWQHLYEKQFQGVKNNSTSPIPDVDTLIDRIEAWNGDSPDMLKSSAIDLVREYQAYAEKERESESDLRTVMNTALGVILNYRDMMPRDIVRWAESKVDLSDADRTEGESS